MMSHRMVHWSILVTAMALLTLPNLGTHSFWDVDEGVNAEAAREMMEAGTLITPLFNFELRTAKPVLLYWLQMLSYSLLGVSEFAARMPSVLCGMATVLAIYELGRSMFGPRAGLLAGLVLASSFEFCMLMHAATPDSPLLLFTALTFLFYWLGSRNGGRSWFLPCGITTGLAMLTKGPIGLGLPALSIFIYLLWNRELRRLRDWRLVRGFLAFLLVAAPWYVLVSVETKGVWIRQFIGNENVTRFAQPMENHRGPIFYHVLGILVLFAPWSVLLAATVGQAVSQSRTRPDESSEDSERRRAYRLLNCWGGTYLIVFSLAATKLPNYVLPVYPVLALLTARLLDRWLRAEASVPRWAMPLALAMLASTGVIFATGMAIVSGKLPLGIAFTTFPELGRWIWIGVVPLAGAVIAWRLRQRDQRQGVIVALSLTAVLFVALLAAFPIVGLDHYKAPRSLVVQAGLRQRDRDIRLLALEWFQPSLVFYSEREVRRLKDWREAAPMLATDQPVYLFVPDKVWTQVIAADPTAAKYRTIARQFDFYKNGDILVVTNQ